MKYDGVRKLIRELSENMPRRARLIFADGSVELAPLGANVGKWINEILDRIGSSEDERRRYATLVGSDGCGKLHELLLVMAHGPLDECSENHPDGEAAA